MCVSTGHREPVERHLVARRVEQHPHHAVAGALADDRRRGAGAHDRHITPHQQRAVQPVETGRYDDRVVPRRPGGTAIAGRIQSSGKERRPQRALAGAGRRKIELRVNGDRGRLRGGSRNRADKNDCRDTPTQPSPKSHVAPL